MKTRWLVLLILLALTVKVASAQLITGAGGGGSSSGGGGSGTVTSIGTTSPITGGTITTTGTIACATCTTSSASLTAGQLLAGGGTQTLAITNLTGDVTTSGGVSTTINAANKRRVCTMDVGSDNGAVLANADLGPQGRLCFVPAASTVVEVNVAGDAGTPSVLPAKNSSGAVTNLLSASLSTASAGGIACSNTGGTTGLDGVTTCTNTLNSTSLAQGDYIQLTSGVAGGVAKRMSIFVIYTIN